MIQSKSDFVSAADRSFPVFWPNERSSTPLNSTPYVVGIRDFADVAAGWPGRFELVQRLLRAIKAVHSIAIAIDFILIGGSFTVLANEAPHDLDAMAVYRVTGDGQFDAARLGMAQQALKSERLDIRFIPGDGDPLVLIKAVSFFSVLYSKREGDMNLSRGLILVNCRDAHV